ncbi:MAG: hypothetical protein U1F64_08155 [Burkholderiales bacterium]
MPHLRDHGFENGCDEDRDVAPRLAPYACARPDEERSSSNVPGAVVRHARDDGANRTGDRAPSTVRRACA